MGRIASASLPVRPPTREEIPGWWLVGRGMSSALHADVGTSARQLSEPRWVLIADDDADHRVLLSSVIRRAGFVVREACDGQEVLDILREHGRPSCVVTDLMMPRLSGFGVLEHVRESDPGLPIVLISAVGDDAMRTLATDLGAAAMLHKPFDFSALRELVVRVADRPTRPH